MAKMTMEEVARAGRTSVRLEHLAPDCMVTAAQVERYVEDRIAAMLEELTKEHDALDEEIEKLSDEVEGSSEAPPALSLEDLDDAPPEVSPGASDDAPPSPTPTQHDAPDASEEATGPIPIADARTE